MKLPHGYVPGVGVPKHTGGFGGFGQKMLEKMGWQDGQGLGKGKSGRKDAIEVNRKEDTLGVGATQTGWKWDWKYWEDAYNGAIKDINHEGSSSSSDDSSSNSSGSESGDASSGSSSDDSSDDSSDEGEPALDRLLSCTVAVNRDGTIATGSAHELALAASLAKDSFGRAGRFGGREGKMARIRAQEEQQAAEARSKLGIAAPSISGGAAAGGAAAPSGTAATTCKKRKASSKAPDAGTETDAGGGAATDADSSKLKSKKAKRAEKELRQGGEGTAAVGATDNQQPQEPEQEQEQEQEQQQLRPKPKVIVVALKGEEQHTVLPFKPTPANGWWGAKMFSSAGRLEGMEEEDKQQQQQQQQQQGQQQKQDAGGKAAPKKRTEFDEDMQAALYNKLQAAQRQGKRGMGRAAVKIAGGNWEGKKTMFADDGDDDAGKGGSGGGSASDSDSPTEAEPETKAAVTAAAPESKAAAGGGRESRKSKKKKDKKGSKDSGKDDKKKQGRVKWVKLAVQQLEQAPKGRMKWSLLWAALWEQEVVSALGCGAKEAKEECWARLSTSSKVELDGKRVKLLARSGGDQ